MGITVIIDSLEDMCALMCDNVIPEDTVIEEYNEDPVYLNEKQRDAIESAFEKGLDYDGEKDIKIFKE